MMIRKTEGLPLIKHSVVSGNSGSVYDFAYESTICEVPLPTGFRFTLPLPDTPEYMHYKNPEDVSNTHPEIPQVLFDKNDRLFVAIGPLYCSSITGQFYMDPIRRAVDQYLQSRESSGTLDHAAQAQIFQSKITSIWKKQVSAVMGKNGYVNRASLSIAPFSGRGVIIPDPDLPLDGIRLPYNMLRLLVSNPKFSALYHLGYGDIHDMIRKLDGQLVLVGRQPTHSRANLMSLRSCTKTSIHRNHVFALHPAIVHIYSGDFDGDTMYAVFPSTDEGKADLPLFTLERTVKEVGFHPGKELTGITWKGSTIATHTWVQDEISTTTGQSINHYDLLDQEGNTGFYANSSKKDMIIKFSSGLTEEEAWEEHRVGMVAHRAIKDFTALGGGLSASLIQLAFVAYDTEERQQVFNTMGKFKHAITQASLDGKNKVFDPTPYNTVYDMFHNPDIIKSTTRDAMIGALEHIKIDNYTATTVVSMMFDKFERKPINSLIKEFTPLFYCTRKQQKQNGSELLQESDEMLRSIIHGYC